LGDFLTERIAYFETAKQSKKPIRSSGLIEQGSIVHKCKWC
jgi:hypothetical protein